MLYNSRNSKGRLWQMSTCLPRHHINARTARSQGEDNFKKECFVLSVAYSPDGRRLASGSMDGTVAVFDTASGKLLHTLDGHFKPVRSLAFTPGALAHGAA